MTTETHHPDYEALGIFPDTWACIAVLSKADAKTYVWSLAQYNVPCRVSHDDDGKRWHVAIQGGMAASPAAWIASFRPNLDNLPTCPKNAYAQHPQPSRHG